MRVCVTGGTGFVGSHVARVLSEAGHQVRVLHRERSRLDALLGVEFESAIGDVTDYDSLERAFEGCDWVFHVAAIADYWRQSPDWIYKVNVDGTRYVAWAAQQAGIKRLIFTSSAAAIGLAADKYTLATEETDFNVSPRAFPYADSKRLAEQVIQEAIETRGLDAVIVNPVVVLGPGDINMISGTFIQQLYQWQWLTPIPSGGLSVIDVRDVARMQLAAAENGVTGERYLLSQSALSYHDFFQMIAEEIGVPAPQFVAPRAALPVVAGAVSTLRRLRLPIGVDANQIKLGSRYACYDGSKAARALTRPTISIRQSIRDTFNWYVAHRQIDESFWTNLLKRVGHIADSSDH